MSRGSRRAGRRRLLYVLIGFIVLLVLAETALVVAIFASPKTGDRLRGVIGSIDRAWNGADGNPGIRTNTARVISDTFDSWVVSLWKDEGTPSGNPEFSECVKCHREYAENRRFPSVYMNHPLHAELGVACDTCHPQNVHPNPPRPAEEACATCHSEVESSGKCGTCHPPGSLPHFYLLGAPRQASVQCDVCHPRVTLGTKATTPKVGGTFFGQDESTCLKCHEDNTCSSCHQPAHPADWPSRHGIEAGMGGPTTCYSCHTGQWCGTRCHSITPTAPFSRQPLPNAGVDP